MCMTNVNQKPDGARGVFGDVKPRNEVIEQIQGSTVVYEEFLRLRPEFQERFIQFCMGVRGVQMTYDPFFIKIFDAEIHPERLSRFLSEVLGRRLKIKRMLPNEHKRITDRGSLLIMDMLVEFETGELADVEIQKVGYRFPGPRTSCYSSDMVMRQYERIRSAKGKNFSYKDLKKVYTIVLMEDSSKELKAVPDFYIHRGRCEFDTGLKMELLEEFYFISLDVFLRIMDNRGREAKVSELEAWLYFIGSDKVEHIQKVIKSYPWFAKMYEEIGEFRRHPEEAIRMFSDALKILDENTVQYMIDEMKQEIDEKDAMLDEKNAMLNEKDTMLDKKDAMLEEKDTMLEEKDGTIEELKKMVKELQKELQRRIH